MWLGSALCAALVLGAPQSHVGKIRIAGTSYRPVVSVVVDTEPIELRGDLVAELSRLGAIKVDVSGEMREGKLVVHSYRILDIGGGVAPTVGVLVTTDTGLALNDGDGSPIPLSLPARSKKRLLGQIGAKVWVHGVALVSGELKVRRYGVLRDAPKAKTTPKPIPAPEPVIEPPGE